MPSKILIVEDDPHIRGLATAVLESAEIEVRAFETVKEGLQSFRSSPPDLVLTDINLPDGTGFEICAEVKASRHRDIPVIVMTSQGDLETRLKCFKLGAQDYIAKPFAVEELAERVKTHLKLKESRDALAEKNVELEMRKRARQDMTDMIVHDLRAPMTSIQGSLTLVRGGKLSKEQSDGLLDHAGSAAKFMILMLNDLLDISRAEQTGLKAEIKKVETAPLLTRLKQFFAPRCQMSGIGLSESVSGGVTALSTDENLLFRILTNLISNALRVSRKGDELGLACVRHEGSVRFVVSDRGPGVPDAAKAKIFEKFTSETSQASIENKGVGIGLTFCRLATTVLGGRIWVEDREGGGSLFIVELKAD